VEKLDATGGGLVTRELNAPGFKHDMGSTAHMYIKANPLIANDELGLVSKYGLKYIPFDPQEVAIFPDGRQMVFWRDIDKTCESIAEFNKKDAEAYRKLHDWARPGLDLLLGSMFAPPPPLSVMMSMFEGDDYGRELKRGLLLSALDICNDWFEGDAIKSALVRLVTELLMAPQSKGTGLNLYLMVPFFHDPRYQGGVAEGGAHALAEALERCLRANGGTIMVKSPIRLFKVEEGKATGVVLESGEEVLASKLVVSNLNIKQMVLDKMIPPEHLPPEVPGKVQRIKQSDFVVLHQLLALNEPLKFDTGGWAEKTFYVVYLPQKLTDLLRGFDDYSYGIMNSVTPMTICQTLFDPTRAPKGKHTLYLLHFAPARLADGGLEGWDKIKQKAADDILGTVREHVLNLDDRNIVGRTILTPLDFYRYNRSWFEGDFNHFGPMLGQLFADRPLSDWPPFKTPIDRLYLSSPSASGTGGGVTGASGRAAAMTILQDQGINFDRVVLGK
jgi:phytoene dehydrogenase-like protein